jgi:hypothetical protein
LVVWGAEFGRTPLSEGTAGRDHHPYAFSMFLAGGGVRAGYVHGATDEIGWAPVEGALHVGDLHATLLHLFGIDHTRLTFRYQGLDQRLACVASQIEHEGYSWTTIWMVAKLRSAPGAGFGKMHSQTHVAKEC